jgi:hypothetical protein
MAPVFVRPLAQADRDDDAFAWYESQALGLGP